MSLVLIECEIKRFLSSPNPEVLCIKGKWGVGKTHTWNKLLKDSSKNRKISLNNYSYISLFGLNSMPELRYYIFESTIPVGKIPDGFSIDTLRHRFQQLISIARKGTSWILLPLEFFNLKGTGTSLLGASFGLVQEQIVCFDDLERRGKGLEIKDILGLASFLREERKCKVILLLNDEQLGEGKAEFDSHIEKVVDTTIEFKITPQESLGISFKDDDDTSNYLRKYIEELEINNIRVINKIKTTSNYLKDILSPYDKEVLERAISILVLGSWSIQQPSIAPPIGFIENYNSIIYSLKKREMGDDKEENPDESDWSRILDNYGYHNTDHFNQAILDGLKQGYFDHTKIEEQAALIEKSIRASSQVNTHSKTWRHLYHWSLSTEDTTFFETLYNTAIENIDIIEPHNINSDISLFRRFGQEHRADDLIKKYIEAHKEREKAFFDIGNFHISVNEGLDEAFRDALSQKFSSYVDTRNPIDVLTDITNKSGWNRDDEVLLSQQSAQDFEKIFETINGPELKSIVEMAMGMGNVLSQQGSSDMLQNVTEGLRRIARKSPLKEHKIRSFFGVELPD